VIVVVSLLFVLASAAGCAKEKVTLGTDTISPDTASPPMEDTSTAQASTTEQTAAAEPSSTTQAPSTDSAPPPTGAEVKVGSVFAIIGDYGTGNAHESAVAAMVAKWRPSFVITTGNNYYKTAGGSGTAKYDESTGAHYGNWLKDISTTGSKFPTGKATVNSFFPALGTTDYSDATPAPGTYLNYFTLPGATFTNTSGNERYYDFVEGPIHFFVLNSNPKEPDGTSATSKQGIWLQKQLAGSTARWNIVVDHHPPYSSDGEHASATYMRWPFADWGATAVISGRANTYERTMNGGVAYMVNGLGGAAPLGSFKAAQVGSVSRFNRTWGAQKVTITDVSLDFEFISIDGGMVDRFRLPLK
jgi:tartrate-resistant acid phosphatase type 5